jgi:hypothetical protein
VFAIHAVPDGSYFIVDGIKTEAMNSRTIIAYKGGTNDTPMWRIGFPEARNQGNSSIDSAGTVLDYWDGGAGPHLNRTLPHSDRGPPDAPANRGESPALGRQIVFRVYEGDTSELRLARPGTATHFLTLGRDEALLAVDALFTPDGRFLIRGLDDGSVSVGDLTRIQQLLVSAGFPGW